MRSRRLTHSNLEILSQRMATYAATSIFFRILALVFSSKFVMSQEQIALCKNMEDCEFNFARFRVFSESAVGRALIDRHCKNNNRSWREGQFMFTGAAQPKGLMAFYSCQDSIDVYGRIPEQRTHGVSLCCRQLKDRRDGRHDFVQSLAETCDPVVW